MSAHRLLLCAALLAVAGLSMPGLAQENGATGEEDGIVFDLGSVVVVGTRVRGVAREDLAVPVDVYEIREISATGSEDLSVALQKTAPSFNSKRNALGDGGLFHTAALRGMSPDHTLVLVNGKRRHGISFPRPLDAAGQGTTGADLRAIPMAAIERIEVLRDGAASQYGSDAIGGVINVVLKEDPTESTARLQVGSTGEGDGGRRGASANLGLPLGAAGGALNLTAEVYDQGRTDRAFDTSAVDAGGPHDPPIGRKMVLGEPEHDIRSLFLNLAAPAGEGGEIYAFGGWSLRNGLSSGAWRDPYWAVERLVGPVYPDGFLPFEKSTSEDRALTVGLRSLLGEWNADASASWGANTFDFGAIDSINSSWAADWLQRQLDGGRSLADIAADEIRENAGPRSGDSGGTELESWALDFDIAGEVDVGGRTVEAAFGAEYRRERFGIRAGDFASWGCGLPDNAEIVPRATARARRHARRRRNDRPARQRRHVRSPGLSGLFPRQRAVQREGAGQPGGVGRFPPRTCRLPGTWRPRRASSATRAPETASPAWWEAATACRPRSRCGRPHRPASAPPACPSSASTRSSFRASPAEACPSRRTWRTARRTSSSARDRRTSGTRPRAV